MVVDSVRRTAPSHPKIGLEFRARGMSRSLFEKISGCGVSIHIHRQDAQDLIYSRLHRVSGGAIQGGHNIIEFYASYGSNPLIQFTPDNEYNRDKLLWILGKYCVDFADAIKFADLVENSELYGEEERTAFNCGLEARHTGIKNCPYSANNLRDSWKKGYMFAATGESNPSLATSTRQ